MPRKATMRIETQSGIHSEVAFNGDADVFSVYVYDETHQGITPVGCIQFSRHEDADGSVVYDVSITETFSARTTTVSLVPDDSQRSRS